MNKILISLILVSVLFIFTACDVAIDAVVNNLDKDTISKISESVVECNDPYIRFGGGCCLDANTNGICDTDDTSESSEEIEEEIEEVEEEVEEVEEEIVAEEPIVSNFLGSWDADAFNHLQFSWDYSEQETVYYVALDMWNTYNTGPLGSIDSTVSDLQGGSPFGIPSHVAEYQEGMIEIFWGWDANFEALPSLGTFRVSPYLLDSEYNIVEELDSIEIVVDDYTIDSASTPYEE